MLKYSLYWSILPTDSVLKKWAWVLGRSFHVNISVHSSNIPINATKNYTLIHLLATDDDNLIRKYSIMAL